MCKVNDGIGFRTRTISASVLNSLAEIRETFELDQGSFLIVQGFERGLALMRWVQPTSLGRSVALSDH
jgi:hypothetical protein